MIKISEIIAFNRLVGGDGQFQSLGKKRRFIQFILGHTNTTRANVCAVARFLTNEQIFTGSNHRTGLLVIYLKLIEDLGLALRTPAYITYGCMDFDRWEEDNGRASNTLDGLITNAGVANLHGNAVLRQTYMAAKQTEIIDLPNTLARITAVTREDRSYVANKGVWDANRANKHTYKAIRGAQAAFRAAHGGTTSEYF